MEPIAIVILAAGQGKRMGGDLPKVAVCTLQKSLIQHVLSAVASLNSQRTVVVVGHKREVVEAVVIAGASSGLYPQAPLRFAHQREQRGTGDAVKSALSELAGFVGPVLVLYGDTPLLTPQTLQKLVETHQKQAATLSFLTFDCAPPHAYGRVIRDGNSGAVQQIKEAKDCSAEEGLIREANAGVYVVDSAFLAPALEKLSPSNAQGELYLTDIVAHASKEGQRVLAIATTDMQELQGVNTLQDLAQVNKVLQQRTLQRHIDNGVRFVDPNSVFIDPDCEIASGVLIGPNVQLKGRCSIAAEVVIEGTAYLENCQVQRAALLRFATRAEQASIGEGARIGPFAHLRPGSRLEADVHLGNFVETKNAVLEKGAKANHLAYLGDCHIGASTNVGAGTIFCNYDGFTKAHTEVGSNVFIGSNSCLVAPLTLGDGCSVAAGSVVSKGSIPADALAVARAPLQVLPGKAREIRARKQGSKNSKK